MLTAFVLILSGIFLAHVFADTIKAAVVVLVVAAVFCLVRGVTFEALVDDGARALFDHPCHHVRRI